MKKRKPGRPIQCDERKKVYSVTLEPSVADKIKKIGKGNLSAGIALLAKVIK